MKRSISLSHITAALAARVFLVSLLIATILDTPRALAAKPVTAAPTLSAAKAAILRLALNIEPGIPFASARIAGMGRDAQGRWWVQGWTEARPEFKGEPGEQWYIIWNGNEWTYHGHGTGLEREDIAAVSRWQDPPKTEPRTETLITPKYIVLVEWPCPEGDVTCDEVGYTGTSRKTGATLTLKGRSRHTTCRGEPGTPCRFIGYQFESAGTAYFVGENGVLQVTRKKQVLLEEQGKWDWE